MTSVYGGRGVNHIVRAAAPGYDSITGRRIVCEFCYTTDGWLKAFGASYTKCRACPTCIVKAEFEIEALMWNGVVVTLDEYVRNRAIANIVEEG